MATKHRTGHIYQRKAVGNFYLQFRINGKKVAKSLGTTNRREAQRIAHKEMEGLRLADETEAIAELKKRLESKQAAAQGIKRRESLKVVDAWEAYIASGNRNDISPSTLKMYEHYWNAFTEWLGTEHPHITVLERVTYEVAEGYKQTFQNRTGRTFNAHRAFLRSFFNVLAEKSGLDENPWAKLKKRTEHSQGRRPLTQEELLLIFEHAEGEIRIIMGLGLYTGCRMGDACRIRWDQIDWSTNTLSYTPHKTESKKPQTVRVPLHPFLREILSGACPKKQGYVTPELADMYETRGPHSVSKRIQTFFKTIGFQTTSSGKGKLSHVEVGFHSLRHSTVSLLRNAGAAQSTSQALVGHSSADVHNLYTHVDESALQTAINAIPSPSVQTVAVAHTEQIVTMLMGERKTISRTQLAKAIQENISDMRATLALA